MSARILRTTGRYTVPNKRIYWSISKYTLNLDTILDWSKWQKYREEHGDNKDGILLPPEELGKCDDWHFRLPEAGGIECAFFASWSLRRVKNRLEEIDTINDRLSPYAVDSVDSV